MKKQKNNKDKQVDAEVPEQEEVAVENKQECESCAEYKTGWKRALADYENLQKENSARLDESRKRIKADFAHDLLPVMDNFHQAIKFAPEMEKNNQSWMDGVTFIEKQFEEVLKGLGLERIDASIEFDPNLHEAVGEGDEQEEVNSGWKIGDTVIRPAQMIIKKEK